MFSVRWTNRNRRIARRKATKHFSILKEQDILSYKLLFKNFSNVGKYPSNNDTNNLPDGKGSKPQNIRLTLENGLVRVKNEVKKM